MHPITIGRGFDRHKFVQLLKENREHIFPVILGLLFVVFVALGLHGWSIGKNYEYFSSTNQPNDPALLFSGPKDIRSDEWLILTPKSIAQYQNGLKKINTNIGTGEDEAIIVDAPTDDFSAFFAPQNAGFHFLPLGNALSFKWLFLSFGLLISVYYFVLRFFTKRITVAIALSLFVLYAPLVQWTFRSILIMPLITGLCSVMVADVIRKAPLRKALYWMPVLGYSLFAFILPLYPPFQISVAFVLAIFYLSLVFVEIKPLKKFLVSQAPILGGVVIALLLTGIFYVQNQQAIHTMTRATFPGVRHFETGKINSITKFENLVTEGTTRILSYPITTDMVAYYTKNGTGNQSEAAATVWIIPPLFVTFGILLYENRKNRNLRYLFVGMLFLQAFVILYLFVPHVQIPIINQVQPNRFNVAILLVNVLSIGEIAMYLSQKGHKRLIKSKKLLTLLGATWALQLLVMLVAFYKIKTNYNAINQDMVLIATVAMALFAYWLLRSRIVHACVVLSALTVFCTYDVNPVYRGVDSIQSLPIVKAIKNINSKQPGGWFFDGSNTMESLPLLADVQTITTNMSYRQDFWKFLDPSGERTSAYNRSAHVMGDIDSKSSVELAAVNRIIIHLNPCDTGLVKKLNITYVVTTKTTNSMGGESSCMQQLQVLSTKAFGPIGIYRIVK